MRATRYVALLRGINVGGRNLVSMAALRAALEAEGYNAVSTYIQSGNVLFETDTPSNASEDEVEAALERQLGFPLVVVTRSYRQLRAIVDKSPEGFGNDPGSHHCDVIFLKPPLTSQQAIRVVALREGVDRAWEGNGVLYFARVRARRTESRLSRIVGTPEYQRMTIRNWATTTKLLGLLDSRRMN